MEKASETKIREELWSEAEDFESYFKVFIKSYIQNPTPKEYRREALEEFSRNKYKLRKSLKNITKKIEKYLEEDDE